MTTGERFQQLRELQGWSQAQVADVAGVSQPTVARLEGDIDVSDAQRQAVVSALGADDAFLSRPIPQRITTSTAWFKAHSDMRAWERDRAHRWGEIAYETLLHLRKRVRLPAALTINIDPSDIETAAQQLRDQLGIQPDQPIANLTRTVERAGVRVLPLPLDSGVHAAFSMLAGADENEPVLFLFHGESAERNRFTVAHELGHVTLHQASRPPDARTAEREANAFAGALLLPRDMFLEDLNNMSATLSTFLKLKPRWGVSIQAMILRAHELGRVSDWQKTNLFTQLSARGWRTVEPLALKPEHPKQFPKALTLAYGEPPQVRQLARDLAVSSNIAAALVGSIGAAAGGNPAPDNLVDLTSARRRRRPQPPEDAIEA